MLIGAAVLFIPLSTGTTAVEVALAVASLVYGGLLGAFLLGMRSTRADARSVTVGMIVGIGVVAAIWIFLRDQVAWPWFVPIGTGITFLVGAMLGQGERPSTTNAAT